MAKHNDQEQNEWTSLTCAALLCTLHFSASVKILEETRSNRSGHRQLCNASLDLSTHLYKEPSCLPFFPPLLLNSCFT